MSERRTEFWKRWFAAVLVAALLGGGAADPARAAEPTGEQRAQLARARQSYDDGLPDLAEQRLRSFLKAHPDSPLADPAKVLLARTLYQLGRYPDMVGLLTSVVQKSQGEPDVKREAWEWLGRGQLALGRGKEAEDALRKVLDWPAAPPGPLGQALDFLGLKPAPDLSEIKWELAWALLVQGKDAEADELLESLGAGEGGSRPEQQAALLRAKRMIIKQDVVGARAALEKLLVRDELRPEIGYEAAYLLAEMAREQEDFATAEAAYRRVTDSKKAFPRGLVAKSWLGLGQTLENQGQGEAAAAAYEQAFTIAVEDDVKLVAFIRFLESAHKRQRLDEAVTKLQAFAQAQAGRSNAAALFAIGEVLARSGESDKAVGILESLLVAHPETRWRRSVQETLARIHVSTGRPDAAVRTLEAVVEEAPAGEAGAARILMGRLLLQRERWDDAVKAVEPVRARPGPEAEQAWLITLEALEKKGDLARFIAMEEAFRKAAPQRSFSDVAMLRGALEQRNGQPEKARETYTQALAGTQGEQRAELLVRLGDSLVAADQTKEAAETYDRFLKEFPKHPLAMEIERRAILAGLRAGTVGEEDAIRRLQELSERADAGPVAADILLQLADLHYSRGDYANAQLRFEQLAKAHPGHPAASEALYFAGLSAMRHGELADAVAILDRISEKSPLKGEARLVQARLYHQQLKLESALTLYNDLLAKEKSGPRHVEALLGKGECLFALGEKDRANYEQAAAAYGAIVNGNLGTRPQRHEAAYRRAKAFEKLGRTDDALELYLAVLYGRLDGSAAAAEGKPPQDALPEQVWQTKAGLDAARLRQERQDWKGAIEVYQRLEEIGGPHREQFRELRNRLRREHYIFE